MASFVHHAAHCVFQTTAEDRLRPAVFSWKRSGASNIVTDKGALPLSGWSRGEAEARIPHLDEFHRALEGFVSGPGVARIDAQHCIMFSTYSEDSLANQFMVGTTIMFILHQGLFLSGAL